MVSGIVLAAGESRRMGREKLLLDFKGKPVVQWVLEAALSSELGEIVCVVRQGSEVPGRIQLEPGRSRWATNSRAHEGQSTSLAAGLRVVSHRSSAALFLVGDQPLIKADLINAIIDLYLKSGAPIVAPVLQGESRSPVLFHRSLFPELLQLSGDRGGRSLIGKYRDKVALLSWEDEAPFLDLDVWQDYEKLKAL